MEPAGIRRLVRTVRLSGCVGLDTGVHCAADLRRVGTTVPGALGQHRLKRLALFAGLLLLAAQTLALQHVHIEPGDAACTVCASTLQDDGVATISDAEPVWPATAIAAPRPDAPAVPSRTRNSTRARAPPTR